MKIDIRVRGFAAAAMAVIAFSAVAACGDDNVSKLPVDAARPRSSASVSTPSPANVKPARLLLTNDQEPGRSGLEARVGGVLGVNDAGCVTVGRYVLVAPRDSTLSRDGLSVNITMVGTLRLGERLVSAGGYFAEREDPPQRLPARYKACAQNDFVVVTPVGLGVGVVPGLRQSLIS